jgi:hypothetical protein
LELYHELASIVTLMFMEANLGINLKQVKERMGFEPTVHIKAYVRLAI